jgi:signal transduction histidine kinase/CHASE3 domain sensor protein
MNFQSIFLFTSSAFLKKVFLGALFILICISAFTYRHTLSLSDSTASVMNSQHVHLELEQLMSYMKDAETGQRGYILTQNPAYLQPYNGSREKVENSFALLRTLTSDNPKQQNNLDSLHKAIGLRYSFFEKSLTLSTQKPLNKIEFDKVLLKGKDVMDNIRNRVDKMIDLEMIYLKERQAKYDNEISFTPIFTLLLFLFTTLIFVIAYMMINRDLKNVKKANEKLTIINESIDHAEIIGKFCLTEWDLTTNKLTYSDNLYRLLGCEPQSFEPTVENYSAFVHPEDIHIVQRGADDALNKNETYVRNYRIIRADGEIRYFKSAGKMIQNEKNHKTHIGIINDVTEQHLSNLSLEERNLELEQTNKELASFNHVASHDLQEPLRKIQLFISRIEENEKQTLTEIGKEYFDRINVSALRMRVLIDDLLLFSRTNKAEKIFERTDLNVIFQKAKNELTEAISEKNGTIQTVRLPILNVIPFQIEQLFINLISNSLKYNRVGVKPVINIECEKIRGKDYSPFKVNGEKKYFKFTFKDNGIGFEQKNAENIFTLFYRLHHKTEYSGTGIGLSICKKIVENHTGFITAEGRPDEGSTFTFFLPE